VDSKRTRSENASGSRRDLGGDDAVQGVAVGLAVEAVHKKMERALSSPLFDDGSLIFKSPAWAMRLGAVLLWQRKGSR
jgi:hypothetical protein